MKAISVPQVKINPWILTAQSVFTPFESLDRLSQDYGEIFATKVFGLPPTILLSNPDEIKAIITGGYQLFDSGETNNLLEPILGKTSSLLLDGKPHQQHKKILSPPLNGEALQSYGQLICNITKQVIHQWRKGQPIPVGNEMRDISLRIILQLIWGLESSQVESIQSLMSQWLDMFSSPLKSTLFYFPMLRQNLGKWSPWGRFLELRKQVDSLIYSEIHKRRQQLNLNQINYGTKFTDILSLLIVARDEEGEALTDEELRDELVTLLFAGHETTAAALSWVFYWVHYLPEMREKLLEELPDYEEQSNPAKLAMLPYLTAVCQESLRICPVILMAEGRILKQPFKLRNYEFTPGTTFMPCIYLLHQREEIYPKPKQFQPERFLERKFSAFEYMPFGGGNRRCLGMNLALFKMKLILATVLLNWELTLPNRKPLSPIRRGIVMSPPNSFQLVPVKRFNSSLLNLSINLP